MTAGADVVLWNGDALASGQWSANAADGSSAGVTVEAGAPGTFLRFDFALAGAGSWAIARRELDAALPSHYAAVLELHGAASPAQLQLKLVDLSGANVWWWRRSGFAPTPAPARLVLHRAGLEFAWGPASGGEPGRLRAVELAVASDEPATGTLWISDLRIAARDPAAAEPRPCAVRASSYAPACEPERVLEADEATCWQPAASDGAPWLELDFGRASEWGGVIADFKGPTPPCRLLASDDGVSWTCVAETAGAPTSRCWLRTAEGEGRYARLSVSPAGAAVAHVSVAPLAQALSPARYMSALARQASRGRYPRHLLGEQSYWALVGADGDDRKGLLSEGGALEVEAESFSLEPFLWIAGRLFTWADVEPRAALADGHLPIPSVEWNAAGVRLTITACALGASGQSSLMVRYRLENTADTGQPLRLFVAVRPFQVNPAWQSLNLIGGVAPIYTLECTPERIDVNATHAVIAVSRADASGGAPSEVGLGALADGHPPAALRVDDPVGFAEAAFAYDVALAGGATETIAVVVPLHEAGPRPPAGLARGAAAAWADAQAAEVTAYWRQRLADIPLQLPPSARSFGDALRASLAWILVNREGPRIQPGPRCYRRSWIRDGTLTGTALAEMGFGEEARAFLRWYVPFQYDDGRVPCAVDRHGIDRAIEHDSHGQLAWGIIAVSRLTQDRAFLRQLWPHVRRAVDAIAALRAQRTTDAFSGTSRFGLLPESISHEGYASHPVHSYWDDFFAVRALADASEAAAALDDEPLARQIGTLRDAMRADLRASIERSMAEHRLDVLPGSAELGDFDPTSTAIAFDPCAEFSRLPAAALARTFARYWEEFEARRSGTSPAEAYAPYEVRNATALLLLGQRERALVLLEWLLADQRPTAWRQWPEIAWKDPRLPRFFGDLPHGWIASTFVRAVRRLLVYERDETRTLVLAAGVPETWIRDPQGIRVQRLPTLFGTLDFAMASAGADRLRVTLSCRPDWPPGGIEVVSPRPGALRAVVIDGRTGAPEADDRIVLRQPAAEVILEFR